MRELIGQEQHEELTLSKHVMGKGFFDVWSRTGLQNAAEQGGYSLVIPTWVCATERGRDLGTTDLKLKGYPHLRRF